MSRLDRMRKIFEANSSTDAAKPINTNTNAEKILEEMLDKAIPMLAYFTSDDIEEAIFGDAIDEGLNAIEIHNAIRKLKELDKCKNYECMSILSGVDVTAVALILLMLTGINTIDKAFIILGIPLTESHNDYDEEKQDDEERKYNHD